MQNKTQTIFIIGAGAIGKVLAVFLKQQGKNIYLLHARTNNKPDTIEHIEVELKTGEIIKADVLVSNVNNCSALNGIIILTTKSFSNQQMAERLKGKTGNSPIIILQNGLNVESSFLENDFPGIYRCVLFTSSQYGENNKLRFKPAAISPIGIIKGNIESLAIIIENLNNPYLIFEPEENIQPIIWTKAIINCVFNSVCPLLETDNGIFHRNEKALRIAKQVVDECIVVALSECIQLSADKVLERLLLISKSSDGQLISTYQDIINKRKTEINTLNFAIAGIADKLNKTGLTTRTKILGELIQIKSEITMENHASV
ncbi:MAG: ketopantoate reductase C-terminal domain-containing protein [Ferruginibacter sp.]